MFSPSGDVTDLAAISRVSLILSGLIFKRKGAIWSVIGHIFDISTRCTQRYTSERRLYE